MCVEGFTETSGFELVFCGAYERCLVVVIGGGSDSVVCHLLVWMAGFFMATSCRGRFQWSFGG